MGLLTSRLQKLRKDPSLLFARVLPFVSLVCIIVGTVWLFLLPLDEYSRRTYISENALLPGQVHTYFSGSEQNIFRGYKRELEEFLGSEPETSSAISEKLQAIFRASGLKVATQTYEYKTSGSVHSGRNVYAIVHAPRGDATEAIVLVAAWRTIDGELNLNGVTLALTLARYFKRWSLWSKDIIVLIPPDSIAGTQAWIDAYHDMHPASVQDLPLKSGALQGAIVFEYPFDHRFESLHIVYDGVNGQLPNLDLINTAVAIAGGQMGIGANLQEIWNHDDSYWKRLETMLSGMYKQSLGFAAGAHSSFIPYHIDAVTLQTKGEGWQDEMALGRTIESLCRSLNNLLEHLHQSFFFYLLMQTNRFVSIGTYMPSAMLVAANFTVMAIALWLTSGDKAAIGPFPSEHQESKNKPSGSVKMSGDPSRLKSDNKVSPSPKASNGTIERKLSLPLSVIAGWHFMGIIPLYIFNNIPSQYFVFAIYTFLLISTTLPIVVAGFLFRGLITPPTYQQLLLMKSFSLLMLGLFLSALATLNFSLSFMIGTLCSVFSFITPSHPSPPGQHRSAGLPQRLLKQAKAWCKYIFGTALSPPAIFLFICNARGVDMTSVLKEAAFGWNVWGMWTPVIVWCVWWPAWLNMSLMIICSLF